MAGALRTGYTTGACATAAVAGAAEAMLTGQAPREVELTLPRGNRARFELAFCDHKASAWQAGVVKDAGDDPDVTHGVTVIATLSFTPGPLQISFQAGEGVGVITKPGLPLPPGEPAINPVPRQMISDVLTALSAAHDRPGHWRVTVSIPGGEAIAAKTWNPRLGILGGLSILGTTGIVRPFSCAAWIASIHRGIDVARAADLPHAVGATGATSERAAQAHFGLAEHAMLDMGDFAGGMLKYLARHPIPRVTIAGGIGKLTKLAQGAVDLHSGRSQVDFQALAEMAGRAEIVNCNTALEALTLCGPALAQAVAEKARRKAQALAGGQTQIDILVISREGQIIA
ncbi:MAG: cobalt-precorrin-5B (C(1))-methyltransferase, partial [Mangrovicoccus sp.]